MTAQCHTGPPGALAAALTVIALPRSTQLMALMAAAAAQFVSASRSTNPSARCNCHARRNQHSPAPDLLTSEHCAVARHALRLDQLRRDRVPAHGLDRLIVRALDPATTGKTEHPRTHLVISTRDPRRLRDSPHMSAQRRPEMSKERTCAGGTPNRSRRRGGADEPTRSHPPTS